MLPVKSFLDRVVQHSQEHDKRQHFFYSLLLTLGFGMLAGVMLAVVAVMLIGLAKECWDHYFGSGFCWIDMAANLLGIMAALPLLIVALNT